MTSLEQFRARVSGPGLTPGEPGFAEEVAGFNLAFSHAPDVVVGVTNASEVSEAVRFAADHGLEVRVMSTGHGSQRQIVGGMLITTRRMNDVTVDPETRIATIGAGAVWRRVQEVVTPHGLTGITGSSVGVGVIGFILGGGLGPLARSHGFSSDYIRGFEVVTGTGELVTANATENADLFWALRGGKVGLGVVTTLYLEVVPLREVYAGSLFFAEEHIETAFRGWIEWMQTAADDVTTSAAILNLPDDDLVPGPIRGSRVLSLRFAYPGAEADGVRLASPLRELAPATIDSIGLMATADMAHIHNDPDGPLAGWNRGAMLRGVDQDLATALLAHVGEGTSTPLVATEIRHVGGATSVDVPGGSAVGGRASSHTLFMIGVPDPELFDTVLPQVTDTIVESLDPWISDETTINFADAPDLEAEFAKAWPADIRDRLQAVRTLYDPQGLFTNRSGGA
jgi:FAD/FMN-containing dehydrogenase